ncbi:DUF998 domain-containing protein [Micromonospora sp. NPDC005707]|uniref:DUF998 domain-containing protein n=1 Tax=Micromonospora sp. NPDC005707 TaxID=3157050 RepID=UPI0033D34152
MDRDRLGAACWLLAAPVFLAANVVVGLAWRQPPFSWATNNISDLGNVTCGLWDSTRPRPVCSPWHGGMNGAMAATAALLALGALLTWPALGRGVAATASRLLTLAAAAGYALAAAAPADVDENRHFVAALLIFVLGNLGMLVAALAGRSTVLGGMRATSVVLGSTGVAGVVLFLARVDLGIGVGGMERVAVFPLLLWTVLVAVRVVRAGRDRRLS